MSSCSDHVDVAALSLPLPPGPRPLPLVGNLHQLGRRSPHAALARLARRHGPLMSLRLGGRATVVVSTRAAARAMFTEHDAALAGRTVYEAMRYGGDGENEGSIITAQVGPAWRMLRRLCATGFFTAARLDALRGVRAACVDRLVRRLRAAAGSPVDLGRLLFLTAFNHTGNLVLSRDLLDMKEGEEFFYHAGRIMELVGKPNVADFVPWLRWLDPQGIQRGMAEHIGRALEIVGGLVKARVAERENGVRCGDEKKKDLLDVLLEFEGNGVDEPHKLSFDTINKVIVEIFIAGIDTTAGTMEWAMAELLRDRSAMAKAQSELRSAAADGEVEEQRLTALPYLRGVIKETLRLHPPLPLLVPHRAMRACSVLGFGVPEGAQVLVNAWALGRDPETWREPGRFWPERFGEGGEAAAVEFKGRHHEFIPFGSGRRMCPAIPLVSRLLPHVLAALLLAFDWDLPPPPPAARADVDMGERMGISLRKAVPLVAVPVPWRGTREF
ncbi:geraniol 8-hydroxylase-like [Ananas comosus]|uniref:Cytochrome P450 76A2 n=1 Tax=Ananas comosus TaxID=4615 RepID=A0A199VA82_ANACO|nr:geraniol 8-hydroxylase-like [Ananas comosus]OAY74022.1 Cytochrome P450 76A2 [Ananas comosus]